MSARAKKNAPRPVRLHTVLSSGGERVAPDWIPWQMVAFVAGLGAALAGWLVCAAVSALGWFSAVGVPFVAALDTSTQFWLLAHGVSAELGSVTVTLMPLGLSALGFGICALIGAFSFRVALHRNGAAAFSDADALQDTAALTDTGALTGDLFEHTPAASRVVPPAQLPRAFRLKTLGQVVVFTATGYLIFTLTVLLIAQRTDAALVAGLMAVAIPTLGTVYGARRDWKDAVLSPQGAQLLSGVRAGFLALLAWGALLLTVAVASGWTRIEGVEATLELDGAGTFVWALALLAWFPNMLACATAFGLGAGFTIGIDSQVTLASTQLGLLPAIPVFGALPEPGIASPWLWLLLLSGALVGILVSVVGVPEGAGASELKATLTSALAGLLTALVFLALAALSTGNLGSDRLHGIGPKLTDLLLLTPVIMAVSAATTTLLRCFVTSREPKESRSATEPLP
jgi:hypothetical protein